MKIFITNTFNIFDFKTEAEVNRSTPKGEERMAGLSARKAAEWRRLWDNFVKIQMELKKLYDSTPN
jgi:hypothetical protein